MNHPIYPSKHMSAQNNLECQRCISKMIVYTKYSSQSYMMHMARDEINNQYAVVMVSPVYPWDDKDDDNRESIFFDLVKDLLNDGWNVEWHDSVLEAIETYVQSWCAGMDDDDEEDGIPDLDEGLRLVATDGTHLFLDISNKAEAKQKSDVEDYEVFYAIGGSFYWPYFNRIHTMQKVAPIFSLEQLLLALQQLFQELNFVPMLIVRWDGDEILPPELLAQYFPEARYYADEQVVVQALNETLQKLQHE